MEILRDHLVRGRGRVGQKAGDLPARRRSLPVREGEGRGVSLLRDHPVGVDGRPVDARWCRRLEAIQLESGGKKALGQAKGGQLPYPPGGETAISDHDLAAEEGAGRENKRAALETPAVGKLDRPDCFT